MLFWRHCITKVQIWKKCEFSFSEELCIISLRNGLFVIKIINKVVSVKDGLAVTQVDVTALEGSCARCKDMGVSVEHSQLRYVPAAMSCSLTRGPGAVQGKPVLNIFLSLESGTQTKGSELLSSLAVYYLCVKDAEQYLSFIPWWKEVGHIFASEDVHLPVTRPKWSTLSIEVQPL